jgi:hypothetical protein
MVMSKSTFLDSKKACRKQAANASFLYSGIGDSLKFLGEKFLPVLKFTHTHFIHLQKRIPYT